MAGSTRICPYCNQTISYYATVCPFDGRELPAHRTSQGIIQAPIMPGIYHMASGILSIVTGVRGRSLLCGLMTLLFVYCFFWEVCAYRPRLYERLVILAGLIFSGLFVMAVFLPGFPLPGFIANLASPWATARFIAELLA